jgi:hypothetical protein
MVELVVHRLVCSVERTIGWQGGSAGKLQVKHDIAWQLASLSCVSDHPLTGPHSQRQCKRATVRDC